MLPGSAGVNQHADYKGLVRFSTSSSHVLAFTYILKSVSYCVSEALHRFVVKNTTVALVSNYFGIVQNQIGSCTRLSFRLISKIEELI